MDPAFTGHYSCACVLLDCSMVLAVDQKQSKTLGARAVKWSCKVGATA